MTTLKKPIKICRNYTNTALRQINESEVANTSAPKKYVFQGVFTACSTPEKKIINRNSRSYPETEVLRHLSYLRDMIKKQGSILGELDHPEGRFDVQLKEASHKIVDLWYDTKTHCVMGKIELLDTPNGNIAKELVDAGYPLFVSSRAAGDVNEETHEVEIAQIFTYDIVCTPGFEEARLERMNESFSPVALHYINESIGAKKKVKNSIMITEADSEFTISEKVTRAMHAPINMKNLTTPLNEDTDDFSLPEAELDPNKIDNDDKKEDKKESDSKKDTGKKDVKDESPEKKEDLDKKDDISEDDEEAKDEKRKAILNIKAEDKDGEVINGDNESSTDDDVQENRKKILKIYSEDTDDVEGNEDETSESENDKEHTEDEGDKALDAAAEEIANEQEKEIKDRKTKVKKEADKAVEELESILDSVIRTEAVKESIIRRYPFSISLSEKNFGKFAALRPNQKKKCADFIEEHQIFDILAINELWNTPLQQEKRLQQNWLRLATQHDIDLYTMAPKDVQDAIEESAKYVVLETQEEVNEFWQNTGLRQAEAQRVMNEEFIRNYKTYAGSPYDQNATANSNPLGYDYDYIRLAEDLMSSY